MKQVFFLFLMCTVFQTQAQFTIEKQYGDTVDCSGINVIQTFDDGFLITASKNHNNSLMNELFIIKTNQHGDTLWTKSYNFESSKIKKGIQTSDSGYVFTGRIGTSLLLYKVNSGGDSLWTKTYNYGEDYSLGHSIIESSDHELIIVGEIFIGTDVCCSDLVLRTDFSGNILNTISLPGGYGRAYDIVETPDTNFVISYSSIEMSGPIPKLAKVDKYGNYLWYKTYNGACECNVSLTADNGFLISGQNAFGSGPYLVKIDAEGEVIWNQSNADYEIYNYDLKVTPSNDGGYMMVGGMFNTISDVILLKINSLGDSLWTRTFGGDGDDFGKSIITTSDNGFAIVGYSTSFSQGLKEVYFLKTDSLGLITSVKNYALEENQIKIFPNPFSHSIKIETDGEIRNWSLSIYNSLGQEVKRINDIKDDSFTFLRGNLPSGIYYLKVAHQNKIIALKKAVIFDK